MFVFLLSLFVLLSDPHFPNITQSRVVTVPARLAEFSAKILRGVSQALLGKTDDQLKGENRKCVQDIFRVLRILLADRGPGNKEVELLRLNFANKCYQNEVSLETRLDGLKELKSMIGELHAIDQYNARSVRSAGGQQW